MKDTSSNAATDAEISVYYNGACPVCRTEIEHYQRRAARHGAGGLGWCDVTAAPGTLADRGIDDDAVIRRLHVVDAQGKVLAGVDAFIALWDKLPGYRWLARLARVAWVRPIADIIYDRALAPAPYHWNKATGRVPPAG